MVDWKKGVTLSGVKVLNPSGLIDWPNRGRIPGNLCAKVFKIERLTGTYVSIHLAGFQGAVGAMAAIVVAWVAGKPAGEIAELRAVGAI